MIDRSVASMILAHQHSMWESIRGWRKAPVLILFFAGLTAASGCNRGPMMYHVSGTVTYKDGSVPRAGVCLVRFEPTAGSTAEFRKGASSAIAPDGSFDLYTRKPGDGVHPGEYAVAFTICKSAMDTTPQIPEQYANPNLSPYKVTVTGEMSDLKFEIEPLAGGGGASGAANNVGRVQASGSQKS